MKKCLCFLLAGLLSVSAMAGVFAELPAKAADMQKVEAMSEQINTTPNFQVDTSVPEGENRIMPNGTYSDGACLQRDRVLHITGTTLEKHIAVEFRGTYYFAEVNKGKFELYLPAQEAGGPFTMTFYGNTTKHTLTDVYVGEVFLFSGQSNMEWRMVWSDKYVLDEIYSANNEQIRMLDIPRVTSTTVINTLDGVAWTGATPHTVSRFSCFAYLYGKQMQEELGVPVGLITASWGGTSAGWWTPKEVHDQIRSENNIGAEDSAAYGYNSMIAPLQDYAVRNVVWYQGESNIHVANIYDLEMNAMIAAWREQFNDPDLGFVIIGLPRYWEFPEKWSVIREKQQAIVAGDSNHCMTVNLDLGDWHDIHPQNKALFAERAVEETLKTYFGKKDITPYPTVKSVERISDTQVKITFDGVGDGLKVTELGNGFEVSSDGKNYQTITSIHSDGNTVTLTAADKITHIRYGYKTNYTNVNYQTDVSLLLSVWNSYGKPLDQFVLTVA